MKRSSQFTLFAVVMLTIVSTAVAVSVVAGEGGLDEWGLSDKDREELHLRLKAEDIATQRAFLEEFVAQDTDPSTLEAHPYEAERADPRPSLDVALAQADFVFHGIVESQRYRIDETGAIYTISTIAVKETWKGSPPPLIEVTQPGGPRLDGDHAHLIISEANPPLFAGDEVILFVLTQRLGNFLQSYTGQYKVTNGLVEPHPGNPFRTAILHKSLTDFRQTLQLASTD